MSNTIPGEPFPGHDKRRAADYFFGGLHNDPVKWASIKRFFALGRDLSDLIQASLERDWVYFQPTTIPVNGNLLAIVKGDATQARDVWFELVRAKGESAPQIWSASLNNDGLYVDTLQMRSETKPGQYVMRTHVGGGKGRFLDSVRITVTGG